MHQRPADALCTSGAAGVCLCVQGLCGCYGLCGVLSNVQTRFARVELQVCVCVCRVCVGAMVCVVCFRNVQTRCARVELQACVCYGLCGVLLKRADALCTSGAAGVGGKLSVSILFVHTQSNHKR